MRKPYRVSGPFRLHYIEQLEERRLLSVSLLKDLNPGTGTSSPTTAVVMDGVAYFAATDQTNGRELWKTDGTPAGTAIVTEPPSLAWQVEDVLFQFNGQVFFTAND